MERTTFAQADTDLEFNQRFMRTGDHHLQHGTFTSQALGCWRLALQPFCFLVNHHPSIPTVRTVRGDASHSSGRRPRNWAWGSAINHSPTSGHRSHQQVVDFCVPWAFPLVFLWGFPGFPSVFQFVLCFVKFFGSRGLHQGIAVCVHVFADLEGPAGAAGGCWA